MTRLHKIALEYLAQVRAKDTAIMAVWPDGQCKVTGHAFQQRWKGSDPPKTVKVVVVEVGDEDEAARLDGGGPPRGAQRPAVTKKGSGTLAVIPKRLALDKATEMN